MKCPRRAALALFTLCFAFSGLVSAALPGAPLKVAAMPRDGKATVSFEAPASDGGSPITSYTVTSSPGGNTAGGNSTRIVVNGLTNGTAYTFTVRATNASGQGPSSAASNVVRPIAGTITPAVATRETFAMALDAHGQVYAWGGDANGELGQSRQRVQTSPIQVQGLPAIRHIAVGEHVLAVDAFGQLWSWGDECGHLQRDSAVASKPARVRGATGIVKAAATSCGSYVLKTDGTVWAYYSQGPVQIPYPVAITNIVSGQGHVLALGVDQLVYAMGTNSSGELGDGTTTSRFNQPALVPNLTNVVDISASSLASLALRQNGEVWHWGRKDIYSIVGYTSPTQHAGLGGPAIAISAGSYGNYAVVRNHGSVWKWDGTYQTYTQVTGLAGASRLETMWDEDVVFALSNSGALTAKGSNKNGELGQGHTSTTASAVAVPGFASGAEQVAAGYYTRAVLARKSDGTVWFWSENEAGQRGDGAHIGSSVPLAVPIPATITRISAGNRFAVALDSSGNVWGWGNNHVGAINPDWASRATPEIIPGITGVSAVAAGNGASIAYARNGEAWVSGWIWGVQTSTSSPRQIAGIANVVDVAASDSCVFYLLQDGTVRGLGQNAYGELGDGSTTTRATPTSPVGMTGAVKKIVASNQRVMALMTDGRVYQWGADGNQQSVTAGSNKPTLIAGVTTAVDIATSGAGALIRLGDGSVVGLGHTLLTGYGNSQVTTHPVPSFPQSVQAFALGGNAGLFVGSTGLAWGWRSSPVYAFNNGVVGDGTYVERASPVVALAHAGRGSVDGNNWYLDLMPESGESIAAAYIPKALATARRSGGSGNVSLEGTVGYRSSDLGKKVNNYVLALVPPSFLGLVPTAAGVSSPKQLASKAAKNGGFVLVQLTPSGWTDVTGQLLSFSQGLASAGGTASNILNGIPASSLAGSRFCIGYGETADSMLSSGSLREVLVLEGASSTSSGVPCVLSGVYVNGPRSSVQSSGVTFTASVVGIGPTGSVQFRDGPGALGGPVALSGSNSAVSTAQFGTFSLALGAHSIGASYSGDGVNPAAEAAIPQLHVVSASSQTSIQGSASSELGSETAFVATVTGNNPSGTVQFRDGGANLGDAVPLAGGIATLRTAGLALGGHTITAAYSGDGQNAASTSPGVSHSVVNVLPTKVDIGSSANPVSAGSAITITVSVSGPGATPSGSVTLRDWADSLETKALSGGSATFTLGSLPGGLHAITAHYSGDGANPAATSNTLFQEVSVPPGMVTIGTSKVGTGSGTISSIPAGIDCGSSCAAAYLQGSQVTLTATPASGSEFHGWTSAPGCGANTACVVTLSQAMSVTATFRLYSPIPRLGNISTRALTQTGDHVVIGGFVIGGTSPKTVIVRARGPSMAALGVPNTLANPQMQLYSGQTPIASNDNWQQATNAAAITASGFAPTDPNESAILMTLDPGGYTVIVTGVGNTTGIAIVEVFEVDGFAVPLINISTRGPVQTGDGVMIGGFVIQGSGPQTVVVRARGPSMAQQGVPNLLANPVLTLYSGQSVIATNDDWGQATNASAITASGFAPTDSRESAILMTLQPGAYTAIVTGAGNSTGIAIVEVFKN